jgi:hypothetical protein
MAYHDADNRSVVNDSAGNSSGSNSINGVKQEKLSNPDPQTPTTEVVGEITEIEAQKTQLGHAHFHRLGWKRLTIVLLVEAIALGSLSIPSAFATLGMVAGVITCVGLGLIAIYTSYIVGQVKLKFPEIKHYADAGKLMMGRFGYGECRSLPCTLWRMVTCAP